MRTPAPPVLINAIGCVETGARTVLRELMSAYPHDGPPALLIHPASIRTEFRGVPPQVRLLPMNRLVWGRYLRPVLELAILVAAKLGVISRVVNLSHYGWCAGSPYVLYLHNALLLEPELGPESRDRFAGIKRWWLSTCIRSADKIIVQTDRIAGLLRRYAVDRELPPPRISTVLPESPRISGDSEPIRSFDFQLFYPASPFPHKRVGLAIAGTIQAHEQSPHIGLIVTSAGREPALPYIRQVGSLSREEVHAYYRGTDALLFASRHETLGLPLLEALELGLPAVLPALDYAREIYGDAGVYFDEETPIAVANAIGVCVSRYSEFAARARRRHLEVRARSVPWAAHWAEFGVSGPVG